MNTKNEIKNMLNQEDLIQDGFYIVNQRIKEIFDCSNKKLKKIEQELREINFILKKITT